MDAPERKIKNSLLLGVVQKRVEEYYGTIKNKPFISKTLQTY